MEHIEREIFFALQVKFAAEKINATLQTRMGIKTQTGSVQTTTKARTAKSKGLGDRARVWMAMAQVQHQERLSPFCQSFNSDLWGEL